MMHRVGRAGISALFVLVVWAMGLATAGCAQKDLLSSGALTARHVVLRLNTVARATASNAPSWVLVGAIYLDGDEWQLLAHGFAPLSGGNQVVELPVDLGPCLAFSARSGKDGCPLYVAAALVPDTLAFSDSTRNLFGESYDSAVPIGPFEVAPGRVPTIPPIDLSMTRFAAVRWSGDEALKFGGRDAPSDGVAAVFGALAPISGVANGAAAPTLFAVTRGANFTYNDDPRQFQQTFPQLAIFDNGEWRRVSGPFVSPVQGTNDYNGVTALANNDVYLSSTTGLFRYDGTAINRNPAVTDPLVSVASVVVGAARYVIAGGTSGAVWIGNTQTWQRYTLPVTSPMNGVCITGANEAFAISSAGNVAFRFDGSTWTSVPTPQGGGKYGLQCPAAGQAFVLNSGGQAYRWTGTTWGALPTTGLRTGGQLQWAVVSPSEIFAYVDSAGVDRAFYRFNGTTWTAVGRLRYTYGASRPWAPAGGGAAYSVGLLGRVERMRVSDASVIGYQPSLRDVAMNSAPSAFVVGAQSLLARFDGAQWIVDAPPAGTPANRDLLGVWSDGASNAWAVGSRSTILHWGGQGWGLVSDSLRPTAARDAYNAVWGVGSAVWVVGDNTILRCTSVSSCANESAPAGGALLGIWGTSAANIFAVGDGGRILRYDGATWTAMPSPTTRSLARVAGSSATDVWVLGDSVLLHYDGAQWALVPMTGDLAIMRSHVPTPAERTSGGPTGVPTSLGLWVRGPREVYLGSQFGSIARFDGTGWIEISNARYGHRIMAIHGTAAAGGCVMAVTESQYIVNGPTIWRGAGPGGCLAAPSIAPVFWP